MSNATKSAPKGKSGRFQTYSDLLPHTSLPLARRRTLKIGRGGAAVTPRKFHLSDEEISALKAEYKETGIFPNPHNKGAYYYTIAALIELGIDEQHTESRVMAKMEKLMSDPSTLDDDKQTAWERWANKDPRNKETGKDVQGRFDQNVTVLQRLTGMTPYGLKLLQVGQKVLKTKGAVIDVIVADTGTKYLRLNTDSNRPLNGAKTRGMGSPAEVEAENTARREKSKRKAKRTKAAAAATPAVEATAAAAS